MYVHVYFCNPITENSNMCVYGFDKNVRKRGPRETAPKRNISRGVVFSIFAPVWHISLTMRTFIFYWFLQCQTLLAPFSGVLFMLCMHIR